MPYIEDGRRKAIDGGASFQNAGELSYLITSELVSYLDSRKLSYQTINDIIGALEGAKMEFYRRVVAPYENMKASQNGDLYEDQVREIIMQWQESHKKTVKENNG